MVDPGLVDAIKRWEEQLVSDAESIINTGVNSRGEPGRLTPEMGEALEKRAEDSKAIRERAYDQYSASDRYMTWNEDEWQYWRDKSLASAKDAKKSEELLQAFHDQYTVQGFDERYSGAGTTLTNLVGTYFALGGRYIAGRDKSQDLFSDYFMSNSDETLEQWNAVETELKEMRKELNGYSAEIEEYIRAAGADALIAENWERMMELISVPRPLTDAEKREAQILRGKLTAELRSLPIRSRVQYGEDMRTRIKYSSIIDILRNRSSNGTTFATGLLSAIPFAEKGLEWQAEQVRSNSALLDFMSGGDPRLRQIIAGNNPVYDVKNTSPFAYGAGNILGGVAITGGLGAASGAAVKAIPRLAALAPGVQHLLANGVSGAVYAGTHSAGEQTWSKERWEEEERFNAAVAAAVGVPYEMRPYDVWRNIGNVARDTAVGGAVAAGTSAVFDFATGGWYSKGVPSATEDVAGGGTIKINSLDDFVENPRMLGDATPEKWYQYFYENGYSPQPMSQGGLAGKSLTQGGGFKVNWGGDRIWEYHPAGRNHHGGVAYYKISSGSTGKMWFDLNGNPLY